MKMSKIEFLNLIILFFLIPIGCNRESDIVGKWEETYFICTDLQRGLREKRHSIVTYYEDGSREYFYDYDSRESEGRIEHGSWELKGNVLRINSGIEYEIISLNKNKMILQMGKNIIECKKLRNF